MGNITIQVEQRPERKLILKRGENAEDALSYYNEGGDFVWEILCEIENKLYEPAGFWLPQSMRPAGTSYYVQGVEVAQDYNGMVPHGFEVVALQDCTYLMFCGSNYEEDELMLEVEEMFKYLRLFNPSAYSYKWADGKHPIFEPNPRPEKGYILAVPVVKI